MKFVNPEVYLISIPEDTGAMTEFLEKSGVMWRPDPNVSWTENVMEFAGRLCYWSFESEDGFENKNLTRIRSGNKDYLGNIIKAGHLSVFEHNGPLTILFSDVSRVFCYTDSTEVLTREGWKGVSTLTNDDVLLTMNEVTQKAEWEKNGGLHTFDYDGEIHWFESSQWSSPRFTTDHIQFVGEYDKRQARGLTSEAILKNYGRKIPYSEIKDKRFVVKNDIELANYKDPGMINIAGVEYDAETFFEFLGFWVTDGSIDTKEQRVTISQTKKETSLRVECLFNKLFGGDFTNSGNVWYTSNATLAGWIVNNFGRTKKDISLSWLFEYSPRLLKQFYLGALQGDGSKHACGHEVIYAGYETLIKDMQVIVAMVGQASNLRVDYSRVGQSKELNGSTITNILPAYVLSVHNKKCNLVAKRHHRHEHFAGKVYCPQTSNGLIYVRKDGMAFWSGNTHELVRHRAGCAYSQTSGRYVRTDDISFWVPPTLQNADVAKSLSVIEGELKRIEQELDIDSMKDFKDKKIATSALRRLAPNGQANNILMSCNHRAMRHIIELRTSEHAEEEMRLCIGGVARMLKRLFPSIYQDMYEEDGSWKFKTL